MPSALSSVTPSTKSLKIQLSKEDLRTTKPSRDEYLSQPKTPLVVVLDHVTNSYNVGSFIRLADAFAIEKIIVCGELTISDKKLKKASRNEAKWVNIEYSDNTVSSLQTLIADGYTVYSVELCSDSVDYSEVTYPSPSVLVLGNERKGVSEAALGLSHQHIHIPMVGMGNSLNVSTAGAIVMAECANQLRKQAQTLITAPIVGS
ncbi:TrmH family RNA methyltransferase [Colwellia echini]|uniref:TrmH family RNA methyltransferase n=1 Tax=Colwellia echini TaxID=1982103 RepID=A0ABY3MY40_9GAMM|nr:TrmH family RNA methyltransferase [Colwellia echini]TYK66133.1 TrmH family RNA methyltransferase [Colwellia echini]